VVRTAEEERPGAQFDVIEAGVADFGQMSSTAQDLQRGRRTDCDFDGSSGLFG